MPLLRNLDKSQDLEAQESRLAHLLPPGRIPARRVLNFLGLMGGGMPANTEKNTQNEIFTLDRMLAEFQFDKISLGGPVFDLTKLKWLNGEYLRALSPEDFLGQRQSQRLLRRLPPRHRPLVQTRIETLAQFGDLADFFFKDDVIAGRSRLPAQKAHPRRDPGLHRRVGSPRSKPHPSPSRLSNPRSSS